MIHTSLRPELSLLSRELAEAGWPTARYRLRVEGPGLDEPLEAELEQPFLLVGRDRGAGLWLPDTRVRRRHAYLHLSAEGVYLVPLSPRCRDQDAGLRSGWLTEPVTLEFGPYRLILSRTTSPIPPRPSFARVYEQGASEPARRHDLMNPVARDAVTFQLQIHAPEGGCARRRLKRPLTLVGRSKASHLRLVHPSVSQPHCLLVQSGEHLWVVDLLSRRGTRLNEQPVQIARVDGRHRFQVGDVELEVRGVVETGRNGSSTHRATPAAPAPVVSETGQASAAERPDQAVPTHASLSPALPQPQDDVLAAEPGNETHLGPAPAQAVEPTWDRASYEPDAAETCPDRPQNGQHRPPEARPLPSEPVRDVASRLQRLEVGLQAAAEQAQQQAEQATHLALRVEQFGALGLEAREQTRNLAERLDALKEGSTEQQRGWRQQWERLDQRLSDLQQSGAATADPAQVNQAKQQLRDSQVELREACAVLQAECQEWNQRRRFLEEQCSDLEQRVRACEQSSARAEQTRAELQRECETIRSEQERARESAARMHEEFQALAQEWQGQHGAVADEQVRTRERLGNVCHQSEVLQAKLAEVQERWERQCQSLADQLAQREERQAQMEKAFDAHAEEFEQVRQDVAALGRIYQRINGNGRSVDAPLAAKSGAVSAQFDESRPRATTGLHAEAEKVAQQPAPEEGASDDWQDPGCQGATCVAEFHDENDRVLEHDGEDAAGEWPLVTPDLATGPAHDGYGPPGEVAQADETATQWLFQRAATLSERRRRTWRRRIVVGLAAALVLVALIGGFALWHYGLVEEAQRAMFG